jgi:2-oxoglutarate ferredoxin oxidoreductase subunit alpha
MGNVACAEGALAVGCRFFAGYPITPSSEVMTTMANRLPEQGGVFVQMEDEIASISAVLGAAWTGVKAMTATSGPGFSLMMEGFGYGMFTETPLVVVNIQRAGPCTGQATHIGSGDVLQVKYGSHGDVMPIALSPWSVQEMYDLTIRAFNLAEAYRVPVYLMSDEGVGHLRESVRYHQGFETVQRRRGGSGDEPFDTPEPDGVPLMPRFGDGAHLLVTGSTHDGRGFRRIDHPQVHDRLVRRLHAKIEGHADDIVRVERYHLEDAEVAVLAYGFTARAAWAAVRRLRERGVRAGMLRLQTLWPFPAKEVAEVGATVKRILFPELNLGQLALPARGATPTEVVSLTQVDGQAITPATIMERLEAIR